MSLGVSRKDFGDLRSGHGIGRQPHTGYDELDIDVKLNWALGGDRAVTLTHLNVRQDDVPRTHKTVHAKSWRGTTVGSELRRELDQRHSLTYLRYETGSASATLSWQRQEESRFRLRSRDRIDRQGVGVGTLGLSINLESDTALGLLQYGADWVHDRVDSFRRRYNPDGSLKSVAVQGPVADNATYDLGGVFVQGMRSVFGERLDVVVGSRLDHASVEADTVAFPGQAKPGALSGSWGQYTGSLRLLLHLDEAQRWNLFAGYGGGFRAPNLSDLTRLDSARSNEFEVPSAGLKPERYHALEAGLKINLPRFTSQAAVFTRTLPT
jgi:hemoglobin/transferrin/lactoferrin receptor protein